VAPALLPVLKTDLDDFDASTRELCCLSLGLMFEALPGALSEQPVHELYPSLLKRLDDSADPVRLEQPRAVPPAPPFFFFSRANKRTHATSHTGACALVCFSRRLSPPTFTPPTFVSTPL
jgi:hypothetical protein